ncbi:unnamed protein product [Menidia menidia]|uniref:BLOC-1-related complex subunit 7 n=1 Tax=Menidia menidia TaxID=238744 RepID=A0A8S4BRU2_9TELE|nr:unnamed protein product [Menidia menidia]
MASADSLPRFGQSVKCLLSDKVGFCSGDVIALTRQVLKGSRSQEVKQYQKSYLISTFTLRLRLSTKDRKLHRTDSLSKIKALRGYPEESRKMGEKGVVSCPLLLLLLIIILIMAVGDLLWSLREEMG